MKRLVVGLALCLAIAAIAAGALGEGLYPFAPIVEGLNFVAGMDGSGRVIAAGDNTYGQCDVDGWDDVISIAAGFEHLIGLRADGTVLFAGNNNRGQGEVDHWEHIRMIAAEPFCSFGLTDDGKILCAGGGSPQEYYDRIAAWTNIEWISATPWGVCAIDTAGQIHCAIDTDGYSQKTFDYDLVHDVQQVYAIPFGFIALRKDGAVLRCGYENVSEFWGGVLHVDTYGGYEVVLFEDGRVLVTDALRDDVKHWTNIAWTNGHFAITRDGTYVSMYSSEPQEALRDVLEDYISHELKE